MGWHASLGLAYRRDGARTVVHDRHDGPLRVLKSLHDEPGVCLSVVVHPPGGIVGGDRLDLDVEVGEGAHALVTTPGATRWYRSAGELASQAVRLRAANGARLEWLPLETLAYAGCLAESRVVLGLAGEAEAIGWDVLGLGQPASGRPYDRGRFRTELDLGRFVDRGRIDGDDRRLLDSPIGLAGRRALATLWFAAGRDLEPARSQALVDAARAALDASPLAALAGVTAVDPRIVVARVLAPVVEPAMAACQAVWAAWRQAAWRMPARPPRVWRT